MLLDIKEKLRNSEMPIRKKMVKMGTIKEGTVESTPVVWQDRLLRFEWVRSNDWGKNHGDRADGYYNFVDFETEEVVGTPFAHKHAFGCCYEENGVMYAHGVRGNAGATNVIDVFWSEDLANWESQTALTIPEELKIYNTSVCKGENGYIMCVEVSGPERLIGKNFSILFAKSENLLDWELLPIEDYNYIPDRYSACPSIRYFDGMYYMVYLEIAPLYRLVPYIVRSKDLVEWEGGLFNPFMWIDDDDKKIAHPERFTEEEIDKIKKAVDNNNSDVDFCEYRGETYIVYSWGNQLGTEYLAYAKYDGSLEEFLKSFF